MKKLKPICVFLSIIFFSCYSTHKAKSPAAKKSESASAERNVQVTITGMAEHAKMGAILIDDHESIYYIEGKQNWDKEAYYHKKIRVTGTVYSRTTKPEDLVNDKREYSQGAEGETKYIRMTSCEPAK
jgi:hypothetical protein